MSPDLFDPVGTAPTQGKQQPVLPPRLPRAEQLAELSDGDLADLTALLVNELQRRVTEAPGGRTRPYLKRAVEHIVSVLQPPALKRRSPAAQESSSLLNGKRSAIRAALSAGIKPTQVAKHFGVSLAEVRKVASHWATLRRPDDEGWEGIFIFDRRSLASRYRVTPYHDPIWDTALHRNDEMEERVERVDVELADHLLALVTGGIPRAAQSGTSRFRFHALARPLSRD